MDDGNSGIEIWLNPGVVPLRTPAGPVKREWYTLMGAFASAVGTPTCMGDHGFLEGGEVLVEGS